MRVSPLRLSDVAPGRPYHAAFVPISGRHPPSRLHTHLDFCELFYVVSGSGRHLIDGSPRELREGDLTFVRAADRHAFAGTGPAGLQFVNVAVSLQLWRDFAAAADLDDGPGAGIGDPPLRLHGENQDRAEVVFRRALARYEDGGRALDAVRFLADVVPLVQAGIGGTTSAGPEPQWLGRACSAMRAEENLRAGLPRLLDLAAVSHGYLARSMRHYQDRTPVQFVTEIRVRHAAALLTTTDLPVGRIAQRCGFSSQSYFTRTFRAECGISPRAYRDQTRRGVVP